MFEYFPGNYRWSTNIQIALSCGAPMGDVALIGDRLRARVGDHEAWYAGWSWLAGVLDRRASERRAHGTPLSASEDFFLASLYYLLGERFLPSGDA